jgi:hypothetical protein
MTNLSDRFRIRYSTLASAWKALAEGETPDRFPVEWKSINYYAHVFSNDDDATVKTAAQAFLREVEVARLDPQRYAGRLMVATPAFVQAICDQAGIPWQDDRRKGVPTPQERRALKPSAKPKPKPESSAKPNANKAKRPM